MILPLKNENILQTLPETKIPPQIFFTPASIFSSPEKNIHPCPGPLHSTLLQRNLAHDYA